MLMIFVALMRLSETSALKLTIQEQKQFAIVAEQNLKLPTEQELLQITFPTILSVVIK